MSGEFEKYFLPNQEQVFQQLLELSSQGQVFTPSQQTFLTDSRLH